MPGNVPGEDMLLNLRTYNGPECGLSIDRDLNASINLKKRVRNSEVSLRGFESGFVIPHTAPPECKTHSRNAVGLTVNACG